MTNLHLVNSLARPSHCQACIVFGRDLALQLIGLLVPTGLFCLSALLSPSRAVTSSPGTDLRVSLFPALCPRSLEPMLRQILTRSVRAVDLVQTPQVHLVAAYRGSVHSTHASHVWQAVVSLFDFRL